MKNANYKPHIFSLFVLYVCGNAIITLPFYNAQNRFVCLGLLAVISALFVLFSAVVIKAAQKNKFSFLAVKLLVGMISIYTGFSTLYDYTRFVLDVQLPLSSAALIAVTTIIFTILIAVSGNRAIFKYCLLVFVFFAIIMVLLFICGIRHFEFSNLKLAMQKSFIKSLAPNTFLTLVCSLAAPVLLVFLENNNDIKVMVSGALVGFGAIALCLLQSVLTLGGANLPYPYIKAVGVISTGSLFTRLDGLVYFLFFATCVIKIVVCIKTVKILLVAKYKTSLSIS